MEVYRGHSPTLAGWSRAITPDKTVETFPCNFQFHTIESSCPKGTNSPPSPPLVQCCFGLTAQECISCVIVNNITKGEGGNGLLIFDGKHFCQGEWKKIGIFVMCLNRFCSAFFNCDVNYYESLSFFKVKCMKLIVFLNTFHFYGMI